ncbi:MAG: glycosyltransferase [Vicinamibacterales bacterium]
MPLPSITVVIPAFNAEPWIAEALTSALRQTAGRDTLEIIVVDDGSADGTAETAARVLHDSGVVHSVVRHATSRGPSAARNDGWRRAAGAWVQFLDADDCLAPNKFEQQGTLAARATASVAAIYSPWARLVTTAGQWSVEQPSVRPRIGDDPMLDVLRSDSFLQLGCLLFSREWLQRVDGFVESYSFIEDVDLLLRLLLAGGTLAQAPADEPLSFYRQHPGSLSRSDDARFTEGCVRNARLVDAHWSARGELTATRAASLAGIYLDAARYYAGRDRPRYQQLFDDMERLVPGFRPDSSRPVRLLAGLVGTRRAELVAARYRRMRR